MVGVVVQGRERAHHHRRVVLCRQAHQRRGRRERCHDCRAAPLQLGPPDAARVRVVGSDEEQRVAGAAELLRDGEEPQVAPGEDSRGEAAAGAETGAGGGRRLGEGVDYSTRRGRGCRTPCQGAEGGDAR